VKDLRAFRRCGNGPQVQGRETGMMPEVASDASTSERPPAI
jgi:hypothetical protein